jgi:hypothetical protein
VEGLAHSRQRALSGGGLTTTTEARQQPSISFSADVAPILYKHCIACHREGEMGPMPLTSFSEVRPWARAIRGAVIATDMPDLVLSMAAPFET